MNQISTNPIINLFLDPENETEESIDEYLESRGYDKEELLNGFQKFLNKKRGEIKIERGRIFKNKFLEFYENVKKEILPIPRNKPELISAYRKLDQSRSENMESVLSDTEKLKILEYLKEQEGDAGSERAD